MAEKMTVAVCDADALARRALEAIITSEPDLRFAFGSRSWKAVRKHLQDEDQVDVLVGCEDCILAPDAIAELAEMDIRAVCVLRKVAQRYSYEKLPAGVYAWILRDEVAPEQWPGIIRLAGAGYGLSSPRQWETWRESYAQALEGRNSRVFSDREAQVLSKVVKGLTNRQIAETLCISESTVKAHIHKLFEKTGLSRRIDLATWAQEHGTSAEALRGLTAKR
ncbi:MAG TPA: response regulator transcription factor [Actinomycetota bacterium]|nr:response regulator transcription factor [Actinomycetota bacterium]